MAFDIIEKSELATARMEQEPVAKLLSNLNEIYLQHRPQLVDVAYTTDGGTDRARSFEFVIEPSADGLPYRFIHRYLQQSGGDCTITVEQYTPAAGYAAINTPAAIASGAVPSGGVWQELSEVCTVSADATRLRVSYANTAAYLPSHVLAYPEPSATPTGAVPSGFFGYASGLWGSAGAPCHTEFFNRCKASAVAVLRDRKQMAFSFCQERNTSPRWDGVVNPFLPQLEPLKRVVGKTRISLPAQSSALIRVHSIGTTDDPTVSAFQYRSFVRQTAGGKSDSVATLDIPNTVDALPATDNARSAAIRVYGETPAIELGIVLGDATGTHTTVLNSFVGYWEPGA